jgi:hypothetical protein
VSKHVTPHSFRHATAVHLVAAGVDITVIRSWLRHVSLDTTNHYAQANLETKRALFSQATELPIRDDVEIGRAFLMQDDAGGLKGTGQRKGRRNRGRDCGSVKDHTARRAPEN